MNKEELLRNIENQKSKDKEYKQKNLEYQQQLLE